MAFCGQCGFENPDGARFCGSCGAELTQQEVGNVETIVNESTGNTSMESDPMAYVPLDTPPTEKQTTFQETETSAPKPTSYTPEPPMAPTPPPAPQAPPVPQAQAPTPPPAAPAATQVVIQAAPSTTPQTPRPVPPKSGGSGSKTCLGCGCAAAIVLLFLLGGLGWWGYNYYKKNSENLDDVMEWLDKGQKEWSEKRRIGEQDPDSQTYNGKSVRELAEELNFPVVNYGELPKEGRVYRSGEEDYTIRFASINFTEGDYIGTLTAKSESETTAEFWVSPCGCSIYHLSNPDDESVECGYFFVDKGAQRILINREGDMLEFTLPTN